MIFNLAIKGIIRRKRQSIIIVIGFALSVALFVSLVILIKAARTSFMKPFPVAVDMIVRLEGEPCVWATVKLPNNLDAIPQEKIEDIKELPFVEKVNGILVTWAFTELKLRDQQASTEVPREEKRADSLGVSADASQANIPQALLASMPAIKPLVVTGIDTRLSSLSPVGPKDIVSGRFLEGVAKNEAILEEEFARLINKKVGDRVKLGNREFKVVGIIRLVKDTAYIAQAYTDINTAQEMLGQGQVINTIFIKLTPEMGTGKANTELINKQIQQIVGKSANITSTRDYFLLLGQVSQAEYIYLATIFLVTVIISVLFISKSILSYIGEKIRDVGILKAIGWNQTHIIQLIIYENAILGTIGGVVGSIAGYFLAVLHRTRSLNLPYFLNPAPPCHISGIDTTFTLSFQPSPYLFLFAIAASSFFGVFLGYLVALKVSRINAASALRSL